MKITRIEIKDFQQFKDFTLDLTYPAGHPKAGEPLDKVCFIGQSGTGKTTLLNVMKDFLDAFLNNQISTTTRDISGNILCKLDFIFKNVPYNVCATFDGGLYVNRYIVKVPQKIHYIYIPAHLGEKVYNTYIERKDASQKALLDIFSSTDEKNKQMKKQLDNRVCYDFTKDSFMILWATIVYDSKEEIYQQSKLRGLIGTAYLNNDKNALEKYTLEFENIKKNPKSPYKMLKKIIDPVIKNFKVELSDYIDLNNSEDLSFIKIQDFGGNIIPFNSWSTGTKQIILTASPMIKIDSKNTVIFFDEPESSLFPDVQRDLIDYYTGLAPESQFFFATHSPLIASQFEPWEIIELKFDEKTGKVYQEDYVKKGMERHVDNYRFYPKYMRWDSILTEIYDLDADGNEEREQALQELAQASADIKYYKAQGDTEKVANLMKTYKALANKLLWKINEND
ncbi:MAG: hypothetical protein EAZ95_17630 [Bacteroidetes bacterium]|nr:MAG: hypothetical protein EAZ95_17630 [Bacteroidota bacterium]